MFRIGCNVANSSFVSTWSLLNVLLFVGQRISATSARVIFGFAASNSISFTEVFTEVFTIVSS